MKTKHFFQLALLIVSGSVVAQDVIFENSNNSLVNLNSSYAGSNGGHRLQTTIRNQWPEFSNNFVTYNVAYDAAIKPIHGGIALSYYQENFAKGLYLDHRLSLSYAQYFKFKNPDLKLIPSLELTYLNHYVNISRMSFDGLMGYPITSTTVPNGSTKENLGISSGLLVSYKNMYGGLSLKNFNQPDAGITGVYRLPTLFNAHFSYTKKIDPKNSIQVVVSHSQQNYYRVTQFRVNALLIKHLEVGASVFSGDQASFTLGFRNAYVAANLGYALTFSRLAGRAYGVYSFGLASSFKGKKADTSFDRFENW